MLCMCLETLKITLCFHGKAEATNRIFTKSRQILHQKHDIGDLYIADPNICLVRKLYQGVEVVTRSFGFLCNPLIRAM